MEVVGSVDRVAEEHILLEGGFLDAAVDATHGFVTAEDREHAVLDLLERVGAAVRDVDLCPVLRFVDGGVDYDDVWTGFDKARPPR